jgi:hypothetical protein
MAARYPWTPEQLAAIRDGNAAGKSLHSIAAELGVTKRNLSNQAARMGLTWDRSRTQVATAAKVADAKGRRAVLQLNLLDDAERLRAQLWAPTTLYNFGGRDNTYAEHQADEPPFADKLKIMQAVGIAVDRSLKLDVHDSGAGAGVVIGLLQKTAAALGIVDNEDAQAPE